MQSLLVSSDRLTSGRRTMQRYRVQRCAVRHTGFTLIEIMVALAIFVIGALAVIRIFPPALGVVQRAERTTIGNRMARSVLARYESQPGLVPDGVYDYLATAVSATNPSGWNDFEGAVEGTVNRNRSLPAGPRDMGDTNLTNDTALERFKRIVGERHKVLIDNTTAGTPALFVLSRFT
jgi:prepilin-type N-terminal cleavage/methylation domain-containing protein